VALAHVRDLSFAYGGARSDALGGVSLDLEPGEIVLLVGRSGSGKTTLIRALAGLVPHFHGGRFGGSALVGGLDTRRTRPSELAGTVATLFQDPEDQVVFDGVAAEVAFGLENAGVPPEWIEARVLEALGSVGSAYLVSRKVTELSGGELQRVCLAAILALEPSLLLLDEPTAQLDADAASALLRLVVRLARERGTAVVLSEQRVARSLDVCDRVVVLERGKVVLDAPREQARGWLARERPTCLGLTAPPKRARQQGETLCRLDGVAFAYPGGPPVVENASLELHRREVVALVGPNGSGKSTLAKLAAGLLEPSLGVAVRSARTAYLSQDPGRYLVHERCDGEVALGAANAAAAAGALEAVGLAGVEARRPRDLSSGERERLALAAVLATDADVLLLDEPTRGVDPDARLRLAALLQELAARHAIVLVTHDDELVGAVADRVVSLGTHGELRAA
jgi:energy-coupling factor transporter ATP-binding protein EcfA2